MADLMEHLKELKKADEKETKLELLTAAMKAH